MDETEINTEIIGAKGLLDDINFISEKKSGIPKSQESETSFQKNLPEKLSKDKSEKALSGGQTSIFIHTGAPTVSSENFLLPTCVNGPVSHSTSVTTSIMKKGGISLTTAQTVGHQTESSSSASVVHDLQRPTQTSSPNSSEHQVLFLLPEAAHANNLTHSTKNLPPSASLACDMQPSIGKSIKPDSTLVTQVDVCEDSKSSLGKDDDNKSLTGISSGTGDIRTENDVNWDPQKEFIEFLMTNEETVEKSPVQPKVGVQKRRKRKMDVSKITRYTEDCFNESDYIPDNSESLDVEFLEQNENLQIIESQKYSLARVKAESIDEDLEVVDAIQQLIYSPSNKCAGDTSPVHTSTFLSNALLSKCEQDDLESPSNFSTDEPSFYPCTKCNVNFREKKHLHRHMMYHLDGNSHFRHLNVPRPYACRECGRTFRDRNSLLKHMIIHQERRQKLMEEIRELKELQDEGRSARLQCPQCVFGTNCPKTFVQHAKTHEKDKRYYCCEECNFMAVTENELECHRGIAHGAMVKCSMIATDLSQRKTHKKALVKDSYMESSKRSGDYMCKLCRFTTSARSILKKHMEYLHPASCADPFGSRLRLEKRKSHGMEEPLHFGSRTKHLIKQTSAFPKTSVLKQDLKQPFGSAFQSSNFAKLHRRPPRIQKARKSVAQSAVSVYGQSSTDKPILSRNSAGEKHKFLQHTGKQKARVRPSSNYLYRYKPENHRSKKYGSPYSLHLKKEAARSIRSLPLLSSNNARNRFIMDSLNYNAKRPSVYKDKYVTVKRLVKRPKREGSVTGDDLDSYPDFLHKMTVVVLQKLAGKKDSYETEDESSWDNVELYDYTTRSVEDGSYSDINQDHVNLFPLFKGKMEEDIGGKSSFRYEQNDGFYFEYYEDGEGSNYLHDFQDPHNLENLGTTLPKHNSVFHWTDLSLEKKNCPYCPATFETGVGLSNHVRGHLHRAGLSYEARHVVSPEQIATSDKMQHFKRTVTGTPVKRVRKGKIFL